MATNQVILRTIQTKLLPDFRQFKDFLRMVLPKSEEDEKLINLFIDMLSEMIDDIDTAEELSDLKDWFKLRDLVDGWDIVEDKIVSKYSSEVMNFMHLISDQYIDGIDGGGDE